MKTKNTYLSIILCVIGQFGMASLCSADLPPFPPKWKLPEFKLDNGSNTQTDKTSDKKPADESKTSTDSQAKPEDHTTASAKNPENKDAAAKPKTDTVTEGKETQTASTTDSDKSKKKTDKASKASKAAAASKGTEQKKTRSTQETTSIHRQTKAQAKPNVSLVESNASIIEHHGDPPLMPQK